MHQAPGAKLPQKWQAAHGWAEKCSGDKTAANRMKRRRIPPMLADLVLTALSSCDGILFDSCTTCPRCGGELSGYDVKKKRFAIVREKEHQKVITVQVKRFICHRCGQVHLADQPFHPGTRFGFPVVDLCVTLGETMPYSRVSSVLAEMGVVVDRWSVRNYVQKNRRTIPAADMFGIRLPLSIITLSTLAMNRPGGARMDGRTLLAACGLSR